LILSALLSQSYNFMNSIMIGKFLGSEAFAATAVTAQLIEFINSIFFGYLTGIGVYVSVLFGRNEHEKLLNTIKMNFLFSSLFAISISVLCNLFCPQIFDILNVNAEVYHNAEMYFRTYVAGMLFFQFNWGFTYIANGMGMTRLPLIASVITGVCNVALNFLFLVVWDKGIGYSAFATVISTLLAAAFYCVVIANLFRNMHLPSAQFKITKDILKNSFDYGAPSMFQQMTMYCCTAVVSPLINTCSTAAISGYSIANKAQTLICAIYQNSSKANTTFVAQAMGAKRIDKIKEGIKIGTIQSLAFFTLTMGLFIVFAKPFTQLFLDPVKDAESFVVSVAIIRYLLPVVLFNVFNNIFHGIFRAIGSGMLMFVSTLIYAVCFVIYAYIFLNIMPPETKIYGVHLALGAAYITEVIFAVIIFVTGRWKTPEYKMLEKEAVAK
ncbi:MAG: MATE family efflux transporter, partial [Clostridia bacterium]|nr:MATE family efflux transporter [Clostridia bacterium]